MGTGIAHKVTIVDFESVLGMWGFDLTATRRV